MKPQTRDVLRYMKSHARRGISPVEAIRDPMRCMRLSERIREIESEGFKVLRGWEHHGGPHAGKQRRYWLGGRNADNRRERERMGAQ